MGKKQGRNNLNRHEIIRDLTCWPAIDLLLARSLPSAELNKSVYIYIYKYIYIYIYGPASLGTSPPPHPMVMGLYSSAPVPPSPLCVGGGGWWWVVVYPLPPVVWVVWVVVGGGGGGRSCICMYMNVSVPSSPLWCGWCGWWWWKKLYMYVYECIWWYECIFLVFAYDYDMICIW